MALELATKWAVIFKHLVEWGHFSECWRLADVVPVPKKSTPLDVGDFEKIVAEKMCHFF